MYNAQLWEGNLFVGNSRKNVQKERFNKSFQTISEYINKINIHISQHYICFPHSLQNFHGPEFVKMASEPCVALAVPSSIMVRMRRACF